MELRKYAWISLAVAFLMIVAKTTAYRLTGSVSLLSDAIESIVNALGASAAIWALSLAAQPPDDEHAYGHDKAEYFSSGFEGALIVMAAIGIIYSSVVRLIYPEPVTASYLGIGLALATSAVNYILALWLKKAAIANDSIALEADAQHLMSDVISSFVICIGVIIATSTPWWWIDPVMALLVGLNIIRMGGELVRRSINGLLDASFADAELKTLHNVLKQFESDEVMFHAIRTRISGARKFVSMHVLVPGNWSVAHGHELLEKIEIAVHLAFANANVITHIEPNDDPLSFADIHLHRNQQH
ncbi:MAG: cation transporter [Chloroflexia bacterium]|nr:cation transporter [Chloroflexia bacterium]